jgi:galactitol-specific phosphotransferase system IIB component
MGRLIVVACGAGINTSTIAEDSIRERMAKEGFADVEVKRILMADIEGYLTRDDLVMIVSMMKIFRTFDVPVFQGMPFLIGSQDERTYSWIKSLKSSKKFNLYRLLHNRIHKRRM